MRLDKVAAVAEIVSSIAIVITLAYLAIQSQQTNAALFATSRQATMNADVALIIANLDPEIAAATDTSRPYSELTEVEARIASNFLAAFFRVREFAWIQYKSGILDKATWDSYIAPATRFLRRPGAHQAWQQLSQELDPEFVEYVNGLPAE